jgi:hypothetical protein
MVDRYIRMVKEDRKCRGIVPEGSGRKITHLSPCLQGIYSRHYGLDPACLVFRREPRLPCDLLFWAPT